HASVVPILVCKSGFLFDPQNSTLSFIFVSAQGGVVQSNGLFGLGSCNNTTPKGFITTPPAPSNGTFRLDVFNYTNLLSVIFPGAVCIVLLSSNSSSPTNGSSSTSRKP
ncbi:17903_t:CDS:2, partial [Dentiscutata erythropus]